MGYSDILSPQFPQQLYIMITRDTKGFIRRNHIHRKMQHARTCWSAINQVSQENHLTSLWMLNAKMSCWFALDLNLIAQALEQFLQLIKAAMNIPNDIKGTMLLLDIVPEGLAFDLSRVHLLWCIKGIKIAKSFSFQVMNGAPHLAELPAYDMRTKVTIWPVAIAFMTDLLRQVEHQGNR